jgi:putative ABC transport system permease protein
VLALGCDGRIDRGYRAGAGGTADGVLGALKNGSTSVAGAGGSRVCSDLVLIQVALALTLLIGSGLLLRSLERVLAIPLGLGFRLDSLLTAQMRLFPTRYTTPAARRQDA